LWWGETLEWFPQIGHCSLFMKFLKKKYSIRFAPAVKIVSATGGWRYRELVNH
jgi:hypothetical protein